MAVLTPPKTLLEVFESLPEGTSCQVINNRLIMSPAPSDPHQKILLKIAVRLYNYVENKVLGEVRSAPYDVYFDKQNIFQPDIIFIAKDNLHHIHKNGFHGVPDMVIEILSPGTENYDLGEKKAVYEQYGVKEYFAVNPVTKNVQHFKLVDNKLMELPAKKGIIHSQLLENNFTF